MELIDPARDSISVDQFDDRNALLHFMLGLVSVSESVMSAVTEVQDPSAPVRAKPPRPIPRGGSLLR